MRPDTQGDKGRHRCRYAILAHNAPFGAQSVIQPAYQFNYAPVPAAAATAIPALATPDKANIIIEAVKPCEDAQRAYILRLYEAMGDYTATAISFGHTVKAVQECNMLEEVQKPADPDAITFRPFEIKTLKVEY